MAATAAASGLLPETVAVAPSTVLSIVCGLTQNQLLEFGGLTPKIASQQRQRMAGSAMDDTPISQSVSTAERQ